MDSTDWTGAGRSFQSDTFQRAAIRQSSYPKRGRARGRGSGRHVRFAASNGTLRTSTRCRNCKIVGHDDVERYDKDCRNKQSRFIRCKSCNIIGHSENECYSKFEAQEKGKVTDQSSNKTVAVENIFLFMCKPALSLFLYSKVATSNVSPLYQDQV